MPDSPPSQPTTVPLVVPADPPTVPPPADPVPTAPEPSAIGRYRISRVLGRGGFGTVYEAVDAELHRQVAVKVPRPDRLNTPEQAEEYLAEARAVATLDHSHIVPVYDVGRTPDGACYVVSKFIAGSDLARHLCQGHLPPAEAAALAATLAEALDHAHQRGLVHRDVKPANVLLDTAGRPYLADFGLALREADRGQGPGLLGTPAYMSPEQARGEGHLVDSRSDIFSLGTVLYELLTGVRPFRGADLADLLERVAAAAPAPPRSHAPDLSPELERITLKAMAPRACDRYPTARALAEDLRHWLADGDQTRGGPLKVVPRGLRAFDAADAGFFLDLLPGPRDREGLPEAIRFWKTRLEETDADRTFRIGVMYGPSGCGKSSLIKAGLLPRLAAHVRPVYLEATPDATEADLLRGLYRAVSTLPPGLGLVEALAAVRRGQGLTGGCKAVLVLDQFEQWLFAHDGEEQSALVRALRHCDGERLQAVVLVRDDFAMALTRFLKAVEVPLAEGKNFLPVDLFAPDHTRRVLTAFGRAYGRLPEEPAPLTVGQEAFLGQAVEGLAKDGRAVPVQLALFAEMVKGKPWEPATLTTVGGVEGVGVAFLEAAFATAIRKRDEAATRVVLRALLPEAGNDLKGHRRSEAELQAAAGGTDVAGLMRMLDQELRLVTPVEHEAGEERRYQLAHDYLVPSLREWLTRKQRETREGRAELLLVERAALWEARPENRNLPGLRECLTILLFAPSAWNACQRKMMRQARLWHLRQFMIGLLYFCFLFAFPLIAYLMYLLEPHGPVRHDLDFLERHPPKVFMNLVSHHSVRQDILPAIRNSFDSLPANSPTKLNLAWALVVRDAEYPALPVFFRDWIQDASLDDYFIFNRSLVRNYANITTSSSNEEDLKKELALQAMHKAFAIKFAAQLWPVAVDARRHEGRRLRAAGVLAALDTGDPRWKILAPMVAEALAKENATRLGDWLELVRPVWPELIPAWKVLAQQTGSSKTQDLARDILAELARRPAP